MLVGAMNHPAHDVAEEIRAFAALGLEFVDLTLEPPAAATWVIDPTAIKDALAETGLAVVGHTAFYLPIGSPFDSLRRAARDELRHAFELFAEFGARWVNIHADGHAPLHDSAFVMARNLESLRILVDDARAAGVGLMLENTPGRFNTADNLAILLEPLSELGLHLDVGHCNLQTDENTADELIRRYASRLKHVHIHDNKGGYGDLHLPLGTGTLASRHYVHALRRAGYDGTITLEVFTKETRYLTLNRDLLREWWNEPI
jgi:sugar phosphate isomerase/epimerase